MCDKTFMLQRATPPAFQATSPLRRGGEKTGFIDMPKKTAQTAVFFDMDQKFSPSLAMRYISTSVSLPPMVASVSRRSVGCTSTLKGYRLCSRALCT